MPSKSAKAPGGPALTVEGPGLDLLTLDAGGGRRHLNVDAGGNLVLTGLRFTRGDPGGTVSGGAILNNGGTLETRDTAFEDNAAQIGGCLYNVGTLTLSYVRMSNCRARASAGGLFNANGATATIGDIRIEGSSAVDNGGAIGNNGNLLAFRVAMIGNQARFGGAFSEYGTTTLRNSTLSGNTASGPGGGAIHVDVGGRLILTHATVTLNNATAGGGGLWNNGGVVELQNSVIAGNTGAGGLHDARGVLRSLGHNLIGNATGSSFAPDSPSLVGNQLGVAARLGPLADNGGFGRTHAPDHDSPLYDAAAAALGFDGRGLIRPRDFTQLANAAGGNGSDIGAYELQVATPNNVVATVLGSAVSVSFTGGATLGDGRGLGTIQNDDSASIAIQDVTLAEGNVDNTAFRFNLTLTGAVQDGFTVSVSSSDGSANAGSDYSAIPAGTNLSFTGTDGETQSITVQVTGDTILEADETFSVVLGTPSNAAVLVTTVSSTGTIQNDDEASIAINDVSQVEGSTGTTSFQFTVTLTGSIEGGFSVPFTTADGSATAPGDYASQSGTLNFTGTAGETRTVTINVIGDTLFEADEQFLVNLSAPANASVSLADGSGQATIHNDDRVALTLSASAAPNPSSVSATVTVTATLSLPQGAPAPSGAIQVASGAATLCAITLPALSCSYTPNYLGPQNLTLSYPGDANVEPANTSTSHTTLRFADLSISKDDGRAVVNAGDVLAYTIVVRNDGPDQASGVHVEDLIPTTLSAASWTCSGVACASTSGTGSIQQTLSLPAHQQVTYTLTATVVSPAPVFVENMARLTLSSGAPHYLFDPDTADHVAIDVNLGDAIFRQGFESP